MARLSDQLLEKESQLAEAQQEANVRGWDMLQRVVWVAAGHRQVQQL